jgi:hypothetical protein
MPRRPAALAAAAALATVLLAACATAPPTPPPPSGTTVAAPADEVRDRIERAMRELGLAPEATPGGLRAGFRGGTADRWSACPRLLVEDRTEGFPRSDWASPQAREGAVTVGLSPAGEQTIVTVSGRFEATYTDRFRNLPVSGRCGSTGELERALLGAAAGAGA